MRCMAISLLLNIQKGINTIFLSSKFEVKTFNSIVVAVQVMFFGDLLATEMM